MSFRDELRKAAVPSRRVELPRGEVEVRGLTVQGKDRLEQLVSEKGTGFRTAWLVACVYDVETGEPCFTLDDSEWLEKVPVHEIEPALNVALDLTATTMKDLEELEGN